MNHNNVVNAACPIEPLYSPCSLCSGSDRRCNTLCITYRNTVSQIVFPTYHWCPHRHPTGTDDFYTAHHSHSGLWMCLGGTAYSRRPDDVEGSRLLVSYANRMDLDCGSKPLFHWTILVGKNANDCAQRIETMDSTFVFIYIKCRY